MTPKNRTSFMYVPLCNLQPTKMYCTPGTIIIRNWLLLKPLALLEVSKENIFSKVIVGSVREAIPK